MQGESSATPPLHTVVDRTLRTSHGQSYHFLETSESTLARPSLGSHSSTDLIFCKDTTVAVAQRVKYKVGAIGNPSKYLALVFDARVKGSLKQRRSVMKEWRRMYLVPVDLSMAVLGGSLYYHIGKLRSEGPDSCHGRPTTCPHLEPTALDLGERVTRLLSLIHI